MLALRQCLRGLLLTSGGQWRTRQALPRLLAACYSSDSSASISSKVFDGHLTACLAGSRAVLELTGPDTIPFLQGMVTNDMRPLETHGAAPVYAAFLTHKGKFLHDVIFYQQPGGLLMEVDAQGLDRAYDWLARFKLRKKMDIYDVSDEYTVWTQFGMNAPLSLQGWWTDPRLAALGLRSIQRRTPNTSQANDLASPSGNGAQTPPGASDMTTGGSSPSTLVSALEGSQAAHLYKEWRYMHGVPEGETEIPTEKAAPLDYNLDVLQGVSYKKGCYVGQERNSFTHYRGIIRKRCMPFRIAASEGDTTAVPVIGEAIHVLGSSEIAGTVQGAAGMHGLGYLKLRPALQAAAGQLELVGAESRVRIVPLRPDWWPDIWGKEEDVDAAASAAT